MDVLHDLRRFALCESVEYTVEKGTHPWKPFRLFLIRSFSLKPIVRRDAQSEIALRWYAKRCGSTFASWMFETRKDATDKATPRSQRRGMGRTIGKRRQCGRKNSPR